MLRESIINRLAHEEYGIIDEDGNFKSDYMYYFFLGRFLSHGSGKAQCILGDLCENSHRESSYLILLFTIHHTGDQTIVDDILLRTMCSLDVLQPATLSLEETRQFSDFLSDLPQSILSDDTVAESRRTERELLDQLTQHLEENEQENSHKEIEDNGDEFELLNGMYTILKNNKIMGQVLRNRYGALEKTRIEEIVEIIADGGLRLVNLFLTSEEVVAKLARYYGERDPKWDN